MANKNISENLEDPTAARIFDLVLGRVIKNTYSKLPEKEKKEMEAIFLSDDNKKKEKFFKKHMPDFKNVFAKESENLKAELAAEIEKQ